MGADGDDRDDVCACDHDVRGEEVGDSRKSLLDGTFCLEISIFGARQPYGL